jgi:hypothetical protein
MLERVSIREPSRRLATQEKSRLYIYILKFKRKLQPDIAQNPEVSEWDFRAATVSPGVPCLHEHGRHQRPPKVRPIEYLLSRDDPPLMFSPTLHQGVEAKPRIFRFGVWGRFEITLNGIASRTGAYPRSSCLL